MHGMLKKYSDANLSKLHKDASDDLHDIAKQMLNLPKSAYYKMGNYYIYGDYRRGKTWMLHALMNHFIKKFKEKSIAYVDSPTLYDYFINNKIWKFDWTWVDYYRDVNVLMLDDLGQEYRSGSGFIESKLETLLRWRFGHNRITFIGTNATFEELQKKYGESFRNFIEGEYDLWDIQGANMSKVFQKIRDEQIEKSHSTRKTNTAKRNRAV